MSIINKKPKEEIMVKRILAMVLAVTLVVTGFAPSILADAKPKVEVPAVSYTHLTLPTN